MKSFPKLLPALLLLVFCAAHNTGFSQTQKGNWLLEGNIGDLSFDNQRNSTVGPGSSLSKSREYLFSLYPQAGYFVTDNIVIGTGLAFTYQSTHNLGYWPNGTGVSSEVQSKSGQAGLLPFFRYYIGANKKNRFYAQLDGGLTVVLFRTTNVTTYDYSGKVEGTNKFDTQGQAFTSHLLLGFNHFFTESVAFNTSVGYGYNNWILDQRSSGTYLNFVLNNPQVSENTSKISSFVWNFGFTMCIPGHRKTEAPQH
jgi:hypothetical protein